MGRAERLRGDRLEPWSWLPVTSIFLNIAAANLIAMRIVGAVTTGEMLIGQIICILGHVLIDIARSLRRLVDDAEYQAGLYDPERQAAFDAVDPSE